MSSYSKQILMGYLAKDPEVKMVGDKKVANFSIAHNETVGSGENKTEKTNWYNISVWGKDADYTEKYFRKGTHVYLEGNLSPRIYKDKEGQNQVSLDITSTVIKNLTPKPKDE